MIKESLSEFSYGTWFSGNNLLFVALRQNKVKSLPSSQSPRLNQKLIYAMKLQLKKINFKT